MTPIEEAIAELESLKLGESINYTKVAQKYGVDRSTLSRRHRGVQRSKDDQYESQRVLNNRQAKDLITYINDLGAEGLFISHEMLRNFAANITGKRPGKHWPGRFLKQHSKDLICLYTTGIDAARVRADSAYKYTLYFELLARKLHQYNIQAEDIYNMDKKGFLIGMLTRGKRIFSKQQYKRDSLKQRL